MVDGKVSEPVWGAWDSVKALPPPRSAVDVGVETVATPQHLWTNGGNSTTKENIPITEDISATENGWPAPENGESKPMLKHNSKSDDSAPNSKKPVTTSNWLSWSKGEAKKNVPVQLYDTPPKSALWGSSPHERVTTNSPSLAEQVPQAIQKTPVRQTPVYYTQSKRQTALGKLVPSSLETQVPPRTPPHLRVPHREEAPSLPQQVPSFEQTTSRPQTPSCVQTSTHGETSTHREEAPSLPPAPSPEQAPPSAQTPSMQAPSCVQTATHDPKPTEEHTEAFNPQLSSSILQQETTDCNEPTGIVDATPQVTTETNRVNRSNVPFPDDRNVSSPDYAETRPSMMDRLLASLEKQQRVKSETIVAKKREDQAAIEKARERQRQKEAQLKLALEEQAAEEQVKLVFKQRASEAHDLEAEKQLGVEPVHNGRTRTPLAAKAPRTPRTADVGSLASSPHRDTASKKAVAESSDDPWSQSVDHMTAESNRKSRRAGLQNPDKRRVPDIRGTASLTLPSARVDWDACRGRGRLPWGHGSVDSVAQFAVDSQLKRYVHFWLKTTHDRRGEETSFVDREGHWFCDIDTRNGKLLEPLQYKDVPIRDEDKPPRALLSSKDAMKAKMEALGLSNEADYVQAAASKSVISVSVASSVANFVASEQTVMSTDVKIPCHLRPAVKSDVRSVTKIYNQEVRTSHRTVDSHEVSEASFTKIFDNCKQSNAPFLVAVKGWLQSSSGVSPDTIIGFAYVEVLATGIGNSWDTCAATCGRVKLIVHPDYRKNRVGTAMLDVIVSSCSQRHQPYQGYQFINLEDDRRFVRPIDNIGRWYKLYIEVFIKSELHSSEKPAIERVKEHDEWWFCESLETRFCTLLVDHREKLYRHTSDDEKGTYWLDRLTLQHECRDWRT